MESIPKHQGRRRVSDDLRRYYRRQALMDELRRTKEYERHVRGPNKPRDCWVKLNARRCHLPTFDHCVRAYANPAARKRWPGLREYVEAVEAALTRLGLVYDKTPAGWAAEYIHDDASSEAPQLGPAPAWTQPTVEEDLLQFYTGHEREMTLRISVAPGGALVELFAHDGNPIVRDSGLFTEVDEARKLSKILAHERGQEEPDEDGQRLLRLPDQALDSRFVAPPPGGSFKEWEELRTAVADLTGRWISRTQEEWGRTAAPWARQGQLKPRNSAYAGKSAAERDCANIALLARRLLGDKSPLDKAAQTFLDRLCQGLELDFPR